MLKPVWKFYRWFDDLEHDGRGSERFSIFMALMMSVLAGPLFISILLNRDPHLGMVIGYTTFGLIGVSRVWWLYVHKGKA